MYNKESLEPELSVQTGGEGKAPSITLVMLLSLTFSHGGYI